MEQTKLLRVAAVGTGAALRAGAVHEGTQRTVCVSGHDLSFHGSVSCKVFSLVRAHRAACLSSVHFVERNLYLNFKKSI